MIQATLIVIALLLVAVIALQFRLLLRKTIFDLSPVQQTLETVNASYERTERAVRDEISRNREEVAGSSKQSREELTNSLNAVGQTLVSRLAVFAGDNDQKLERMREVVEQRLSAMQENNSTKLDQIRQESFDAQKSVREEVAASLKVFGETLANELRDLGGSQRLQLVNVVEQLLKLTEATEKKLEANRAIIDERLRLIQTDGAASDKQMREEVNASLKAFNDSVLRGMTGMAETQQKQMEAFSLQLNRLTDANRQHLETLKNAVEERLKGIQADNAKQLDQMRQTVDEKLQGTLEKRLGESFKQVSDRLEQVHKGLGEMQALATGVGDLKKVLSNVRSRGTWGEVQLGAMLEQVLHPEQYARNVVTKEGRENVEFALKLPGRQDEPGGCVWLPIDSKFPIEDYQRLQVAQDAGDAPSAETAGKQLESRVKSCANDICEKYLNPPKTTDFGILFLPIEGLFAEVVRRAGLTELLQREYRVIVAGPTTLWAILNSLQMGFRTLAIQKRSSEVWNLLAAIKTEWAKYGEVLGAVQKKLHEASNTLDKAQTRTRVIGRKLRDVEELPTADAQTILALEQIGDEKGEDGDAEGSIN